jgi:A/G-specific adenine glycosylase
MNFGAVVCKPKNPGCEQCPLAKKCFALKSNQVSLLPARTKKKSNVFRYFHFIVIRWRQKILLQRREAKDIWHGLYAPPVLERKSDRAPSAAQVSHFINEIFGHPHLEMKMSSPAQQQLLSHQTIIGRFHYVDLLAAPKKINSQYVWVNEKTIHDYGKPKMVAQMDFYIPLRKVRKR